MKRFKMLLLPAYVAKLYKNGEITMSQLLDCDNWDNILSGATVNKIKTLNSFSGGGHKSNDSTINLLGISWVFNYTYATMDMQPTASLLETLMSDGREAEAKLIETQLHNFELSFTFERSACGIYVIMLNELTPLNDICNRYVQLRSNMGELIDDMSSLVNHGDIVSEPIIQSYMTE